MILTCVMVSCAAAGGTVTADDDGALLPFTGTDRILMFDRGTGHREIRSGTIEDIEEDFILFRRNGRGRIEAIPLIDVEELQFEQIKAHTQALELFAESRFDEALQACDEAIPWETRPWVRDEIRAAAVRCCLFLNRRAEALRRIEAICERDTASRHCGLLPLVWDERIPQDERYSAQAADLSSRSRLRQLAAAASLLHQQEHQADCIRVLTHLRADRRSPLSLLAETQLWRVPLINREPLRTARVDRWRTRSAELPPWLRSGPQYLVGRALQLHHETDRAALEYLWTPLMRHDDPVLSAASLSAAVVCLRDAGRMTSAEWLRAELLQRFPATSAARHHEAKTNAQDHTLRTGAISETP